MSDTQNNKESVKAYGKIVKLPKNANPNSFMDEIKIPKNENRIIGWREKEIKWESHESKILFVLSNNINGIIIGETKTYITIAMQLLTKICIALITVAINENAKINIEKATVTPIAPVKNDAIIIAKIAPDENSGP